MVNNTSTEYQTILNYCQDLFEVKTRDYGTAWRILRLSSITDQIYIKAQRVRSIQEKGTQKIDDNISSEFIGIINYGIMALMQIALSEDERMEIPTEEVLLLYSTQAIETYQLMTDKNHDYAEAWRHMRITSIIDIILMKLLRVKQIEENKGQTLVSEGVDANYKDIINYAILALILLDFKK